MEFFSKMLVKPYEAPAMIIIVGYMKPYLAFC